MHPQAKMARNRMRRAGFRPEEIEVRTTRYRSKEDRAEHGDYGRAVINFSKIPRDRLIEKTADMLAAGLTVNYWERRGQLPFITVFSSIEDTGQFQEILDAEGVVYGASNWKDVEGKYLALIRKER